jgi:hypothetical protein
MAFRQIVTTFSLALLLWPIYCESGLISESSIEMIWVQLLQLIEQAGGVQIWYLLRQ